MKGVKEMKHLFKTLCVALVLVLLAASAVAEVKLDMVFQYMPVIQAVAGTNCLVIESKTDNSRGLYTTDGRELIPCAYKSIDYLSNGFFSAYNDKEAVDGRALWTSNGRMIGKAEYGGFKVFSNQWIAAFVVDPQEQTEKSFQDIKIGSKSYRYDRIDLYYVTDAAAEAIEPVASLDRDAYADAAAHGDYIAIINRAKEISVYNSSFESVPVELKAVKNPLYKVDKFQLFSLLDGKNLGDGYSEVAEVTLGDRILVKATRIAMDGTKLAGLMTADGSELLPPEYEILDVTDHYVLVADAEQNQGLFSLDEGRMIVPCAYTSILSSKTDLDKYVHNGYVCVEKDDKLGFYDVVNGAESCAPKYSKRAVQNIGCTLSYTTIEGDLTVVAGDGSVHQVDADQILATQGDGYLLEVKKGSAFGLIDWYGNSVLPANHYKDITVTVDSRAIIRTSTGLQLDTVTR